MGSQRAQLLPICFYHCSFFWQRSGICASKKLSILNLCQPSEIVFFKKATVSRDRIIIAKGITYARNSLQMKKEIPFSMSMWKKVKDDEKYKADKRRSGGSVLEKCFVDF